MARKKTSEDAMIDIIADKQEKGRTHNPLLVALNENDKKNLFTPKVVTVFHKTGFHLFDYYFGSVINISDDTGKIVAQEPRVGQAAGTINMFVGGSGTGKTTLAVQIAANIIRQYRYANVIHYDMEQRFDISRAQTITRLPTSYFQGNGGAARYTIQSGAIGLYDMQEAMFKLWKSKMDAREDLEYDTKQKDEFGKNIIAMEPTVVLIDSVTSVLTETYSPTNAKDVSDASKLQSNTEGARSAKSIKGFLKDVMPICKEANIIIYFINHINTNMSMNAFIPVSKSQNFLKQDEIIPGGKSIIYFPYNIIKLTAKTSDDYAVESDGFAGHEVMVEPIKSSSNQSGNNSKGIVFNMTLSFKTGFDPLMSLINYGRQKGIIEGNKSRLKFKEDPSFTFGIRTLNEDKKEKPIWECLKKYVVPTLNEHLPFTEIQEFDEDSMDY